MQYDPKLKKAMDQMTTKNLIIRTLIIALALQAVRLHGKKKHNKMFPAIILKKPINQITKNHL